MVWGREHKNGIGARGCGRPARKRALRMYEVTVEGWFAAAHQLRLLDGQLEPIHGHNWHVSVTFRGEQLDGMGVLLDFTVIKPRLDACLGGMHDRLLNELDAFENSNPSAERVAKHIADVLGAKLPTTVELACVAVEEAPGCIARYRPTSSNAT